MNIIIKFISLVVFISITVLLQPSVNVLAQERGATDERPAPIRDNQRPPLNNRNTNHSDDLALDGNMGATDYSLDRGLTNENLITEMEFVDDSGKLPIMAKPELSPDGTHIAYFEGLDGEMFLTTTSLLDGSTSRMAEPEGAKFIWVNWANNNRLIFTIGTSYEDDDPKGKFSNYRITRLFAVDKDMSNSLNLFKPVPRGGIVQDQPRLIVRNQARVIDHLPYDPDHILLNVDEKRDRFQESRVRKININDASYEVVMDERRSVYQWVTDQNSELRFGFSNLSRDYSGDNVDYFASYLHPETDSWEYIQDRQVFKEYGYKVLSFAPNPRFAYIYKGYKGEEQQMSLYDVVADEVVERFCTNGELSSYLVKYGRTYMGCVDDSGLQYVDPNLQQVFQSIKATFGGSKTFISNARPEINKYIIYSEAISPTGTYFLLDTNAGSLSKISDRY